MSDLRKKTCKELRDMAKELGIVGRWDMNKQELIDAIEKVSYDDSEITFETDCIESEKEDTSKAKKTTLEYLSNSEPGTLIAFKKNNSDAVMSGKLVSIEDDEVIIETKMGTIFRVNPVDIIWVKSGLRWPRWVFNLFKADKEVHNDAMSDVRN